MNGAEAGSPPEEGPDDAPATGRTGLRFRIDSSMIATVAAALVVRIAVASEPILRRLALLVAHPSERVASDPDGLPIRGASVHHHTGRARTSARAGGRRLAMIRHAAFAIRGVVWMPAP